MENEASDDAALRFSLNTSPSPRELADLRESVGWERNESDYPAAFAGYFTTVAAYIETELVGWCAVVSDGVRHAFLIDVLVRPNWQRHGVGRDLVARAVEACRNKGISIVHVDYEPQNEAFYQACGFRPSMAGILEL
jgi:GNAT superfamily N-acetyltransferase